MVEIKSKQHLDPLLIELKKLVISKFNESFSRGRDGVLRYQERMCVLDVDDLRKQIMEEALGS